MNKLEKIADRMPAEIRQLLVCIPEDTAEEIEEIHIGCGKKIVLSCGLREKTLDYAVDYIQMKNILNRLLQHSYYAYEDDLAKGFITIEGGHRIGICGKAVIKNGHVSLIREVSSINIRFAKEIKGCSKRVIESMFNKGKLLNTLVVSPPGCGKTTLLRDIARELSENRYRVGICDERSEIAGMWGGISSFDLGKRCDVLDGCNKWEGIPVLIRGMNPDVIITDEIGRKEDIDPIIQCLTSGVSLITSIHGNSMEDLKKSEVSPLINSNTFGCYIFLSHEEGAGSVREIKRCLK